MAEIVKKEVDVKDSEITSTIEETCFIDMLEDEIKLENEELQGKLSSLLKKILTVAQLLCFRSGGGEEHSDVLNCSMHFTNVRPEVFSI